MISREEILKGRDQEYPLDDIAENNLHILLKRINQFREDWGQPLIVTSGYRPGVYNTKARGSASSWHLKCAAVDIWDPDRRLAKHFVCHPELLEKYDPYIEHPAFSPNWVHFQIYPPKSGKRIFIPKPGKPPTNFSVS